MLAGPADHGVRPPARGPGPSARSCSRGRRRARPPPGRLPPLPPAELRDAWRASRAHRLEPPRHRLRLRRRPAPPDGTVTIDYWLYRPRSAGSASDATASAADVATHAMTPLLETANPRLVPLETLAGRNHVDFPTAEEPPWRWQVELRRWELSLTSARRGSPSRPCRSPARDRPAGSP